MRPQRHHFVLVAVIGLAAAGLWPLLVEVVPRLMETLRPVQGRAPVRAAVLPGGALPSLEPAAAWLNGRPDSLGGHPVVMAVFDDTDSRSPGLLRRLEAWHEAYARYGVRVIGVHHPQFAFAADSAVPARFARRLGLAFPIALDPSGRIEPAAGLGSLPDAPRFVVAAPRGALVFRGFAGDIEAGERALRAQLRAWRPEFGFPADPVPSAPAARPPQDVRQVQLGVRGPLVGPLASVKPGEPQTFVATFRYDQEGEPFTPYPVGRWTLGAEGLTAVRGGAANFLAIRYDGEPVGLVASPPRGGSSKLWILRDEAWLPASALGEDAKLDARGASYVEVTEPRLYLIARGAGQHVLKLSPESPGLTLHAVTFGNTPAAPARP